MIAVCVHLYAVACYDGVHEPYVECEDCGARVPGCRAHLIAVGQGHYRLLVTFGAATIEGPTMPAEAEPTVAPDKKPERQPDTGRVPPRRGICRRCGEDRPINRLMLCYRCWVITNLEDDAKKKGRVWREGDPHPAGCDCVGLGEHQNGDGTARGFN